MSAPFPLIFPFDTLKKNLQNLPCAEINMPEIATICTPRKLKRAKLYQNHGARKLVRAKISTNKVIHFRNCQGNESFRGYKEKFQQRYWKGISTKINFFYNGGKR